MEHLVCSSGLRYPGFRLVKEGQQFRPAEYTVDIPWRPSGFTSTIDVERVLHEWAQGATIVLQALHYNRHEVAVFCRALEACFGHPVQANAYYTPRGSQGLAVHHDTHDVLVLQVSGEKRWLVYEPALQLPLRNQRYSPELGAPGKPVEDVVLGPGDTLYLPRGWLHEAVTSQSDSLHLTIGINVYTWLDAFKAAVESCAEDVEFRRSLPGDGRVEPHLLEALEAHLAPDAVLERQRTRFVAGRRPILDGQLSQLRALEALTADTPLERRAGVIAQVQSEHDGIRLSFSGKQLLLPARLADEIAFAASASGTFSAHDLPGELDDAGRLVLVRRLIREGFLRLSEPQRL